MDVKVSDGFWAPIQKSLVRNILGYLPTVEDRGVGVTPSTKPLVTYISRQAAGRRLLEQDHEGLVGALRELEAEGVCDVHVAVMERIPVREQIELVARSTVRVQIWLIGSLCTDFAAKRSFSAFMEMA